MRTKHEGKNVVAIKCILVERMTLCRQEMVSNIETWSKVDVARKDEQARESGTKNGSNIIPEGLEGENIITLKSDRFNIVLKFGVVES